MVEEQKQISKFIDSHTHIQDFTDFSILKEILQRSYQTGLTHIVVNSCTDSDFDPLQTLQ